MTEKKKKCLFTAEPAEDTESKKNLLSRLRALGGKQIRNFRRDEKAVSAVIGFVLIIGILISASSIYFASQIPEWTKDFEALHTADVTDDFSELKARIDGIKGELFERTTHIKMSPGKVPILGISPPGSNIIIDPHDEKFEVIVPVGGGGGGSGNWTIPNATHGFTYYYYADNSNKVTVSFDEVKLSSPGSENLILDEEATYRALPGGSYYCEQVIIKNNSTLAVTPASGVLKIFASNVTVESGSKIDAGGCGSPGGGEDEAGSGAGHGDPGTGDGGGGGAGYGGEGGKGGHFNVDGGPGGGTYGYETLHTLSMGSGGGGGSAEGSGTAGPGGAGGGGIWLDAEKITIDGTISANGANGQSGSGGMDDAGGGGGGSGGGILICGKDVTISGTLSANGGNGGNGYKKGDGGGGGGGGRIKVFHESTLSDPDWSVTEGIRGIGLNPGLDGGPGSTRGIPDPYTSNPPDVAYYSTGYFVSKEYDTGNDSVSYGEMTWDAALNKQELVMKVRTDWNESMAYATHWHDCPELESDNGENEIDLASVGSVSPVAHRYIQFRAELSTDDDSETPVLQRFKVNYSFPAQIPILANATGSIKFNSNYLHYPNQEIVYEHGAVIKYQREGGFMLQRPPIIITNASGIPAIKISLVNLTGANYSYSGSTSTSVKNKFKSYELLADCLKYPDLSINITTEYPSVWGDWFNKTFVEESELDGSYYNVSVTANNVEVNLYGKGDGVELYLERTAVEVEI
ncbi:MAG: hypothetical protein WBC40_11505 [Halobacteriota archaeon]